MNNNVENALQLLSTALEKEEAVITQQVMDLAVAKDWNALVPATDRAKQLEHFRQRIDTLIKDWQRYQSSGGSVSSMALQANRQDIPIPVEERTTWSFVGNNVRVETDGSTKYSNLIPRNLFFSLMMEAYRLISLNGFVKTSHVLPGTEGMIRELSDYQSDNTTRLPIYVAFKLLVTEGIFEKKSQKYSLTTGGEDKFFDLLERIDGKNADENKKAEVTHEEAVRRLREVGEESMANALSDWVNNASPATKGGWDSAVAGANDGSLYKLYGSRMREIIWPYRFR